MNVSTGTVTVSIVAKEPPTLATGLGRHLGLVVSRPGGPASTRPAPTRRRSSRFYAERFPTVELNTTGYRLPAEDQFRRWAEQAPDGFEFAPKLPGNRLRGLDDVRRARVRALGDRLGPVRVSLKSARDEGVLELLLGSLDPALRLAFDLEHPSWDGDRGAARSRRAPCASTTSTIPRRSGTCGCASRRTTTRVRELADRARRRGAGVRLLPARGRADAPAYAERLLELLLSEA